jgi:hypothetical protein
VTAGRIAAVLFAVLVAAAIVVLVISQNVRSRLVVDQVEISNELDPAGERRATIRFRLTEDEESATVAVVDRDGVVVEVLADEAPLGDYEIHRFRWAPGREIDEGTYRIRLTLDSLERELALPEVIDVRRGDG